MMSTQPFVDNSMDPNGFIYNLDIIRSNLGLFSNLEGLFKFRYLGGNVNFSTIIEIPHGSELGGFPMKEGYEPLSRDFAVRRLELLHYPKLVDDPNFISNINNSKLESLKLLAECEVPIPFQEPKKDILLKAADFILGKTQEELIEIEKSKGIFLSRQFFDKKGNIYPNIEYSNLRIFPVKAVEI